MRRTVAGIFGATIALLALTQPSGAVAAGEPAFGCGHVHTAEAQRNPYGPDDGPPPIAIGDSTMLLPIPDLTRVGFDVNAKGCRGFKQSVWVARDLRNRDELPKLILINAYGNGGVNNDLIKFALKVIGPKRTLVLVTAYDADTGHPPAPDTDVLVRAAKDHPDQIKLLDWVKYSLPHHKVEPAPGAWFLPDLFHPNFTGAPAYANFLAQVLPGGAPSTPGGKSDNGSGTPWWPFAVGAAALVLAALFLIRRRVRS
jgi:MYXO-CTERM domain-containing protein